MISSATLLHLFGPLLTEPTTEAGVGMCGTADGSLVVNGETVAMRHAYARAERDAVGAPAYHVILTDVPVAPEVLNDDAELCRRARIGLLHFLRLRVRADGVPVGTELRHPSLEPLGYVLSVGGGPYRVEASVLNPRQVAGSAYMREPLSRGHVSWSYRIDFVAPVKKGGRW